MLNDIVKKAQAKRAKLKLIRSESFDRRVKRKEPKAAAVVASGGHGDPEFIKAYTMMTVFHRVSSEFDGSFDMPTTMSAQAKRYWLRVCKAQEASGVDMEVYLRAQFDYFSRFHGCAPEPSQMATDNAILRAKDFALTAFASRRVVGNGKLMSVEMVELFQMAEKQIQSLQKAHGISRREVYEQFVMTGAVHIPQTFLDADPMYRSLVGDE